MKAKQSHIQRVSVLLMIFVSGVVSFAVENQILSMSPSSATQGEMGVTVTFTLDTDSPPAPPAEVMPDSVTIGGISGASIVHDSQYVVVAEFDISSDEVVGLKDVTVSFSIPEGDMLNFTLTDGFEVIVGADMPPVIVSQPSSKTVQPDSTVVFSVTASGTAPLSYQWQKDGMDVDQANDASLTLVEVNDGSQGDYQCVVTNDFGTATSDSASLTVSNKQLFPIVDTAQIQCYDDNAAIAAPAEGAAYYGQDAQFDGYQPSYTLTNGGLTVTDNVTGLMWTQTADINGDGAINVGDKLSYTEAMVYADSTLNVGAGYAGYTDWRLPTIKELYSLMDFRGEDPSSETSDDTSGLVPFIDTNYFGFGHGDTSANERIIDAQWASSTLYVSTTMDGNETMFGLNLADGRIKGYPTNNKVYYVYFVRGNTGYGVNNFVDNSDGTISDKATGLMWSQDDSQSGLNWQQALAWVQTKNTEVYLGYSDWRLPNVKELQSIVDYTRSPETTSSAAIDPIFTASAITNEASEVDYPCCWSSTTHVSSSAVSSGDSGAYVAFGKALGYWLDIWQDVHGAGAQRSDPKSGDPDDWPTGHGPQGDAIRIYNYVRLVRDIQCGEPGFVSGLDGDLNADCYVDMLDVSKLSQDWIRGYGIADLMKIAENWLTCNHPDGFCTD